EALEERGLAGAVGTDETEDLAVTHGEARAAQRPCGTDALRELVDLYDKRPRSSLSLLRAGPFSLVLLRAGLPPACVGAKIRPGDRRATVERAVDISRPPALELPRATAPITPPARYRGHTA